MSRLPRLVAGALLLLAPGAAALQRGTGAPRPEDGPATIALFHLRPGSGEAPLTVAFHDRSFGEVTSWSWEFGDGQVSNLQNPTHVYTDGGAYDVRLSVTGPFGSAHLEKPGAVVVRSCTVESARANRAAPLERGEDFVPITGDDSLGFYCVYSGKAAGPGNPRMENNVGMFVFPLANGEVLLFGSGYGDANSFVEPTVDASHDVRRVDAIIRFCLGLVPAETPVHFVAPHGHIDHINADCIRELRERGYPIVEILFHSRDATWAKSMPGWTSADRALFRSLRNTTSLCQEELASFASPLGKIWFFLRDGHTPGSIDLVIDVRDDPQNRFIVRGSGEIYGVCPVPGVREAVEPHGNLILSAPRPKLFALGPAAGSSYGGTEVVVSGQGFAAPLAGLPQVFFDGSPASAVTVLSDDTLTCVTPPGVPEDVVPVRVLDRSGQVVVENAFSYRPLPTLTGVSPAHGLATGGTRVTLTGTGFLEGAPDFVTFAGFPATGVLVIDDHSLACTTPAHAAGAVRVGLSNLNGAAELEAGFLYDPVIDVQSVSPAGGSPLGGTRVQLTGSAFAFSPVVPDVFFGAARASSVVRQSDTRIDCTSPAGPSGTSVDVRVSGANGADALKGGFKYFPSPQVTSVAPASGPEAGGTTVTLTGSNFTKNSAGANRVSFGGRDATGVVTASDTSLRCVAPPGVGGTSVDVRVSNANGTGRLEQGYRYHRPPLLTSLEPAQGSRSGGTEVTLRGSGFAEAGAGTTRVLFGGLDAQGVSVVDDAALTCLAPAAAAGGSVDVEVRNENGSSGLASAFRYVTRPVLAALEPAAGPSRGGTTVTLRGEGFQASGAGPTTVRFGASSAADVRVLDDATLTCSTPFGAPGSRVDVVVANQNGSGRLAAGFQYLPLPALESLTPSQGKVIGGTRVRVTGSGFASGGVPLVRFGTGQALSVAVQDDRNLDCTTPPGASGAVDVSVHTAGGTALLRDGFVYGPTRPTLAGLAPDHGPSLGGTPVDLRGSNFLASFAGANTVEFGGVAASSVAVLNDTWLRCVAPPGVPGARVDVRVANANGVVTLAAAYRYHLQPSLASITPAQGSSLGGLVVTLRGSGFVVDEARDLAVRFGSVPATELVVLDDSSLTCRAPAGGANSVVDVELTCSNGRALLTEGFRFLGAPTLESLAPPSGSPLGGTLVTLTGTTFDPAGTSKVLFGTNRASQVTILGPTTLTCLAPTGPPGTSVDVRLENPNGAATLPLAFRYFAAPSIAGLAPGNGPASGGTTVVVTGHGFRSDVVGPNAVTFGGKPARSVITVDDTRVRAVAPAGSAGAKVDLVLTNSNGSVSVALGYRYNATPALGALEPPAASALGGAVVTLRGSGFLRDGAGANTVLFGTLPAVVASVQDDQTMSCYAPAGQAGSDVLVSLTNANGSATAAVPFHYNATPRIDEVLPPDGFSGGGALVEIRGAGWLAGAAGANSVFFGPNPAGEVTVVDDAVLRCRAPAGEAGPVDVSIANANGSAVQSNGFFYDWSPTLTGLAPDHGTSLGGTVVRLTGGGFTTAGAGPLSVRFGATPATNVRVQDGGDLLCDAPPGPAASTVAVVVSNSHGASTPHPFRYHARPTITGVEPAVGAPEGGTVITLRGTGFSADSAGVPKVRFDAADATDIVVVDDGSLLCTAPPGPARTWPLITLDDANGKATFAGGFRWLSRDPADLNDDGVADALVGGADSVFLFFGDAFGPGDESSTMADLVLRPANAGIDFGGQIASGDLNADRIPDLVVAAPLDDAAGTDAGAVFVFYGPLASSPTPRSSSTASAVFRGAAAGDRFGSSLVVRDVNGDGTAELAVGAPLNDTAGSDGGAVYVYRGGPGFTSRTTAQALARFLASGSQQSFGAALAAGDLTGDGVPDLAVGAPLSGGGGGSSGAAYVFRGGASLASTSAASALVQLAGISSGDRFGSSVGTADFDGDGIDELFLGAPDAKNQGTQGGALFLFRGGSSLNSGSASGALARLDGENSGDRLGQVLALGDVDGDGRADLLASAPQHDLPAANAGRAYLVLGGTLLDGTIAQRAHTILVAENSAGDQFGTGLALADLDGDGLLDACVGAPFSNGGGSDAGRVYVFWGAALQATRSAGADDVTYTGASTSLVLGREIASAH